METPQGVASTILSASPCRVTRCFTLRFYTSWLGGENVLEIKAGILTVLFWRVRRIEFLGSPALKNSLHIVNNLLKCWTIRACHVFRAIPFFKYYLGTYLLDIFYQG